MKSLRDYLTNNILYVHGLGSDKNSSTYQSIKALFPDLNIYSESFDLMNPKKVINQIDECVKKYNITKIIASSFGAFYVMCYNKEGVGKILINPCMNPIIEIPKLIEVDDNFLNDLKQLEINPDREDRMSTFAVFGKDDELFSYIDEYKRLYGSKNMIRISGHHKLNERQLGTAIEAGLNYLKSINNYLKESLITEHFVNIFTQSDDDKLNTYKDEVYELLQKAYAPIGGLLGIENVEQLIGDTDFWKLCTKNGKVVAAATYTYKRGGRKLIAAGTNGSPEGKQWLYKILQEDIKFKDRKAWAEVSGAMEHIYINKNGAIPVPATIAQEIMKDKQFIKIHDDGYHYDHMIAGEIHTKILVGNPK